MKKLREFFRHVQINESIAGLWGLLFFNVILSLVPFIVAAPVPVTIAFGIIAGLSIIFHSMGIRIYTPLAFVIAVLMTMSLKSVLPGGVFSGEFFSVLISAITLFKTFNLRKYGDGILLLILILSTNATVLLMTPHASVLVMIWSFSVTLWTVLNLLRLNLKDLSSIALIASLRSALLGTLYTLPLLVFLFYFFQKFSHLSLYAPGENNISGISQTLEPGNVEALTKNSAVAFRAVLNRPQTPFSELYWKGPTLNVSKGMKWSKGHEGLVESPPRLNLTNPDDPCLITQSIFLQGNDLAQYHLALDSPIPSLYTPLPNNAYKTVSKICPESKEALLETDKKSLEPYLEVESDISPEVKALAADLGRGTSTPLEFAFHMAKFYRQNKFKYSLTPPVLSPFHSLDDFLFKKRVGFCEHFSASFATLARLAGYPSRIVTGFQGGKYNSFGGFWVVSYQDSHAWVELWDKVHGWTRVDPTSVVAPERIQKGARTWLQELVPWWERFEDNGAWEVGDAFFFWLRSLFDHRETLISLDDLTVSTPELIALAFALSLLLLVRRARRNYQEAVMSQFKKLCTLLDEKTTPRGRAEGFEHYRKRLVEWVSQDETLKYLGPDLSEIFSHVISIKYAPTHREILSESRELFFRMKRTQRKIRFKTNAVVRFF